MQRGAWQGLLVSLHFDEGVFRKGPSLHLPFPPAASSKADSLAGCWQPFCDYRSNRPWEKAELLGQSPRLPASPPKLRAASFRRSLRGRGVTIKVGTPGPLRNGRRTLRRGSDSECHSRCRTASQRAVRVPVQFSTHWLPRRPGVWKSFFSDLPLFKKRCQKLVLM